jgi:hypothetical protein
MLKNFRYFAAALIWAAVFGAGAGRAADQSSVPALAPGVLPALAGPIHLGDEELPDWPRLYGNCLELDFQIGPSIQRLTLILQTRDLEINAPVYLNYRKFAVLPRRTGIPGSNAGPEEWSPDLIFEMPVDKLCHGLNRITITTDRVARPKFSGDLADFQIRNLRLILK